jgi:uncharacterized protein (TIGR02145 family)
MKKTIFTFFTLVFIGLSTAFAQVGVGTITPDASAALEVQSTTKGFLPPRMITSDRDGISLPAEGLVIYNLTESQLEFFSGTAWISVVSGLITSGPCTGEPTSIKFLGLEYNHVESSGKCWLDRNLGASRKATSSTDVNSYGDLYQWGRAADGHQLRSLNCATSDCFNAQGNNTNLPATPVDVTNATWNGMFIYNVVSPFDWHQANPDNTLWQGVNGTNNPCPTGYRLPTQAELNNERLSWISNNPAGAIASPLKLPLAGIRLRTDGSLAGVGTEGHYWSSTSDPIPFTTARKLLFGNSTFMQSGNRASGYSVRCIKD